MNFPAKQSGSVVVLMLVALASTVNAGFSMIPCSPGQAITGILIGGAIGLVAAVPTVKDRPRTPLTRRLLQAFGFWTVLTALILVLYFARVRVTGLPDWTEPLGEFFTGGMYLALIVAPFTMGVALWFHARGAALARPDAARPGELAGKDRRG